MIQSLVLQTVDVDDQSKIVRATTLADFWDAGLDITVLSLLTGGLYSIDTLGALLNDLIEALTGVNDGLLGVLDSKSLALFIKDMQQNGYNIGFTEDLPIGERANAPVLAGTPAVPSAGEVSITALNDPADLPPDFVVVKAWGQFIPVAGTIIELWVDVTPDGSGWWTGSFNLPADTYTAYVAVVDDGGLRGFRSALISAFVVT